MSNDVIPIDFDEIIGESDLAWHLLLDGSDIWDPQKEWFPKSECVIDEDEKIIQVPEWLAIRKELV